MELPQIGTVTTKNGEWKILTSLRSNGKVKSYIVPRNHPNSVSYWAPFHSLIRWPKGIQFEWLFVPDNLRWLWIGHLLQELSFRVAESLGMQITETVHINKPWIALLLGKYWFWPDDERERFIFRGKERAIENYKAPVIHRVWGHRTIKNLSPKGKPYFLVEKPRENLEGGNIICLWTNYVLIDDQQLRTRRKINETLFQFSAITVD